MIINTDKKISINEDIDFVEADDDMIAPDEDVITISKRLLEKNKEAYEVLAK